jgi:hypothetical protein
MFFYVDGTYTFGSTTLACLGGLGGGAAPVFYNISLHSSPRGHTGLVDRLGDISPCRARGESDLFAGTKPRRFPFTSIHSLKNSAKFPYLPERIALFTMAR